MKRALKFALLGLFLLLLLIIGAGLWLLNDEELLRQQAESRVSEALGRELTIGAFELSPGRLTRVLFRDVRLANPGWASGEALLSIGSLEATIDVSHPIAAGLEVERLEIEDVRLNLEENANGQVNWKLAGTEEAEEHNPGGSLMPWRHLRLARFELSHQSPGREAPLELRIEELTVDHSPESRVEVACHGGVGGYPLSVDGFVEPFEAMFTGGQVSHQLTAELGEIRLLSQGTLEDVTTGAGARIHTEFSGPEFAWLLRQAALPEFSTGPFETSIEFDVAEDRSVRMQLKGDLGSLEVTASGTLDRLVDPDLLELIFTIRGPDLNALGEALGVDELPSLPYRSEGKLKYDKGAVEVERFEADFGPDRLSLSGNVGPWPALHGTALDITADGSDISTWGPSIGLQTLRPNPFTLQGRFLEQDGELAVEDAELTLGESTLGLDGSLGSMPGFLGARLDLDISVPHVGALGNGFGRTGLPAYPLDLHLVARNDSEGLEVKASEGRLGDAGFGFNAELVLKPEVQVRTAQVSASGPEFRHFFDREALSGLPGQFRLEGKAVSAEHGDRIEGLNLKLGSMEIAAEGEVVRLLDPGSGNLTIRLEVPDLKEFHPFLGRFTRRPIPSGPASISATVSGDRQLITLTGISLRHGDSDLKGHLIFSRGETPEILGSFESDSLDISWLTGEAVKSEEAPPAAADQRSQRLFSDEPIPLLALDPIYLDLGLQAGKVQIGPTTLLDVSLGLAMTAEELALEPLEFSGQTGERLSGKLLLKTREGITDADVEATARGFRFGVALAERQGISSAPPADIFVDLTASGATMHEIAGSAVGDIGLAVGKGRLANNRLDLIFSDVISELFENLNPFVKESPYTSIDCGVAIIKVDQGRATVDPLILQTDKIVATSTGEVNLGTEKIDMGFSTRPRTGIGISPGVVLNPFIKLSGTLTRPSIALDATGAAVSGGAAVATGGLSLLGRSLYDRFLRERDPCGKVVAELRKMHAEGSGPPGVHPKPRGGGRRGDPD